MSRVAGVSLKASESSTSRTRRTRAGAIVAVAFAAVILAAGVAVQAQQSDTPTNPFARDPAAAAAGKAIFDGTCTACHGAGAAGGRGPALNGGLNRGDTDYQIFETIHDGIRGTGMPGFGALPPNDIWRLVSYIRSLSPGEAAGGKPTTVTGNPGRGEALFFGKGACATCHEINGRGSDLAADLSAVGARGVAAIASGLSHEPRPSFGRQVSGRWVDARYRNGTSVRGYVRAEDTFSTVIRKEDGTIMSVDRRHATVTDAPDVPKPPTDLKTRLSQTERDDLVSFLAQQTGRSVTGKNSVPLSRPGQPTAARLRNSAAEPHNWMTYWGSYKGEHFTELKRITTANVGRLQVRWAAQLPGQSALQATPLVVDGIMYVAGSPGEVQAIDARTGLMIWRFQRKQDVVNPYQINPVNRGVAVLDGRVFVGTLDNLVIALDARTGRELWERRIADTLEGFTISMAPLAIPGKVIVSVAGGEYGLRGHIDALDAATGDQLWRFYTIPGPGEKGNETWPGDTWKIGGGGVWLTGSYDPDLNLLYWAVGNPAPEFNPHVRAGDNLYTNSVVALDPNTGTLRWHYQFTPNDGHDWDAIADLVLADQTFGGRRRKLLYQANRNGFYYVLDRETGQFLLGTPFVRQSWNDGFDAAGRPKIRPESVPGENPVPMYPAIGATNFQAPSFDRATNRMFFVFTDMQSAIASERQDFEKGKLYLGGRRANPPGPMPKPDERLQGVKAVDAATGKEIWRYLYARPSLTAGVLGTRGGVLFVAGADGNLTALDMKGGKALWHIQTGTPISASPMSYAIDGQQYVAISAGNTVYSLALPSK